MKWLSFVIAPPVILVILQMIEAVIVGGFLDRPPGTMYSVVSALIVFFLVGAAIHRRAPNHSRLLTMTYCTFFIAGIICIDVISTGAPVITAPSETLKFYPMEEIAKLFGIYLGAFIAWQPDHALMGDA